MEEIARSLPASDGQSRPLKRQRLEDKLNELTLEGSPEPTKEKFEPSTKMRHMLDTLLQWFTESPDDKIIVYSQCKAFTMSTYMAGLISFLPGTSMLERKTSLFL